MTRGGRCLACQSPRLAELDAALAQGESYQSVATRFDLGVRSIRTHKNGGHVPMSLVVLAGTQTARARRSITEQADDLSSQIEDALQAAIAGGSLMVVGALLREKRSLLPLLAQLAPPPPPQPVDFLKSEDYLKLRRMLVAVLCSDCRAALAAMLMPDEPERAQTSRPAAIAPFRAPEAQVDPGDSEEATS